MSIAATYNETDIEYGVVNIIGAAVDKISTNIGLLVLISIFNMIVLAVAGLIGALLVLGKFQHK
jgi:hypothetical protein